MKKFAIKLLLLCILSGISILSINAIQISKSTKTNGLAGEVFLARSKSQTTNDCTVVYMGDSVCNQLWSEFDEDVDGICHIGCNQAITPAGSYLLLREYLENNPQTKEVYYIIRPQTLANDIWLNYSYQYFVIPFCDNDNWALLEEDTQNEIYNKFGKIFVDNEFIKLTLLDNNALMKKYLDYVQKQVEEKETHRISKTTVIYLAKIRDLCKEYNVTLYIKPNPLSDVENNYGWDEYQQDILNYGFEDLLGDFIENIPYYPETWFSDGTHFTADILEEYGDEIRENVLD
jgi:hypothetical protein